MWHRCDKTKQSDCDCNKNFISNFRRLVLRYCKQTSLSHCTVLFLCMLTLSLFLFLPSSSLRTNICTISQCIRSFVLGFIKTIVYLFVKYYIGARSSKSVSAYDRRLELSNLNTVTAFWHK